VSNAYLSQLEHGKIRQPSPIVLHRLSELYGASYTDAMRLAGYPVPGFAGRETGESFSRDLSRFGDITPDEESALKEYLDFLRSRRERGTR
jgi:HTH-type transcriptional regulator, competence development regulator